MSHFSDIGFPVKSKEDYLNLVKNVSKITKRIETNQGNYLLYTDLSGAQLWIQEDKNHNLIGVNPYYEGKSKRSISVTGIAERNPGSLDGAYICFAEKQNDIDHDYPLVIDVPNFYIKPVVKFPITMYTQLVAFAEQIDLFDDEEEYSKLRKARFASKSFIPSGMFTPDMKKIIPPQARAILAGVIQEYEEKTNHYTNERFYWILAETLSGNIDIVSEVKDKEPKIGGVVMGQFWLTGRILN